MRMRRTALLLVLLGALSATAKKKKASSGTGTGGKKRTGPPELHPALYEEDLKDDPHLLQRRVKFVNTMEDYSPVMIVWAKPEPELGHMSIVNTLGPISDLDSAWSRRRSAALDIVIYLAPPGRNNNIFVTG